MKRTPKDRRVRCATCGLTYDPNKKPLPQCASEDGPTGTTGFSPEERKFMKCVLSVGIMKTIKVPDIPGPRVQLCWAQADTMVRCDRRKGHRGLHSWQAVTCPETALDLRTLAINWRENRCQHTGEPDPALEPFDCPECVADAEQNLLPLLQQVAAAVRAQ